MWDNSDVGPENAALAGVRSQTQQGRDLLNLGGNVMVCEGSIELHRLASQPGPTIVFSGKQMRDCSHCGIWDGPISCVIYVNITRYVTFYVNISDVRMCYI